jgi:alkylated DNA repair dioxygenase AlkB
MYQPRLFDPDEIEYEPLRIVDRDGLVTYDPYFLEPSFADQLFELLLPSVGWKQDVIKLYGRTIPIPRLTAWYGDRDASYTYSGIKNEPSEWIPPLQELRDRLEKSTTIRFNSVLLNRYRTGKDSLSWHADDEPELGLRPTIASISLGCTRTFQLQHRVSGEVISLPLEHGSLLLMSGETQQLWKHQVPKDRSVTGERINLTFRSIDATRMRQVGARPTSRPRQERPHAGRR